MKKVIKEGKSLEEVLNNYYEESGLTSDDILYTSQVKKGKLFKGDTTEVTIYNKEDIYDFVKDYLKEVINNLGLEVNFEIKNKEGRKIIKMYSDNTQILIGHNGQTIQALETLAKEKVFLETGIFFKLTLDVSDYKEKKDKRLEHLAKMTAKDVVTTGTPAVMENMTSYQRRIIHNVLTDFKGVKTHSEGDEPNRHVIIEPDK
jgi:spoIIIJ-associated protein